MPIVFAIVGAAYPFPMFSLHGGPGWFVYFFMVVFVIVYYLRRVFIAPKQQRLQYLGLNAISLVIFVALLWIAGSIVSNAVMKA